jgi:aldehyde:ferredoxin oxidoreductase
MLDEYYSVRGWDERGIPKKDKLQELALNDVAEQLESLNTLNSAHTGC